MKDGERGRNRTFNLLIKSHIGSNIQKLTTHNKPVTYKSLARIENSLQVLEKFAISGNVQPQLQPHLRHSGVDASDDGMSAAFSDLVQPKPTTTYRFAGDCQVPANTRKPHRSWAGILG
jgi:hypothetical protein